MNADIRNDKPFSSRHDTEGRDGDRQSTVVQFATDCLDRPRLERTIQRARRLRELRRKILGDEYFSGPAWELLLFLFESHVAQRRETVGTLCNGTNVPSTTALRWLYRLTQSGYALVREDHLDNRRRFVTLSNLGADTMAKYFGGIEPHLIAA